MIKIADRKKRNHIVLLFSVMYMISYITRMNYGAIILEIQSKTGFSKSLLSMPLTGSFIAYGIGQLISGFCGDKMSPKKLVTIGVSVSVCMNILMPLCQNPYQMLVVWSINGLAQSFLWPPMVKILTQIFSETDYQYAVTKISWGGNIGTILAYLIAPVLISVFHWSSVFGFAAIVGGAMVVIWNKYACDGKTEPIHPNDPAGIGKIWMKPILIGIFAGILLQGMLRDGVTTWMPSYIQETYHFSNATAILTGVAMPAFSILCTHLTAKLYAKKLTNPMLCAGVLFVAGALSVAAMHFFAGENAIVSLLAFSVLTGSMHGVNLILVCMIPRYFEKTGQVSAVSGLLNAFTYAGSAASTWCVAASTDTCGWGVTIMIWLLTAATGAGICLLSSKAWNRYQKTIL